MEILQCFCYNHAMNTRYEPNAVLGWARERVEENSTEDRWLYL
jgi:hypothetical protein